MCSVFLYRTLVGVGRALVVRTETLVWTERLNSLGGGGFRAFNLTAERRGIAQLRFGFAGELGAIDDQIFVADRSPLEEALRISLVPAAYLACVDSDVRKYAASCRDAAWSAWDDPWARAAATINRPLACELVAFERPDDSVAINFAGAMSRCAPSWLRARGRSRAIAFNCSSCFWFAGRVLEFRQPIQDLSGA